jgi:hypothetical protein
MRLNETQIDSSYIKENAATNRENSQFCTRSTPVDCNNMKHIHTLCGETLESSAVTAAGTYTYQGALNGKGLTFTAILKL